MTIYWLGEPVKVVTSLTGNDIPHRVKSVGIQFSDGRYKHVFVNQIKADGGVTEIETAAKAFELSPIAEHERVAKAMRKNHKEMDEQLDILKKEFRAENSPGVRQLIHEDIVSTTNAIEKLEAKFKKHIASSPNDKLRHAEKMASHWLYLANKAAERGNRELEMRHLAREQKWHDKMNVLLGND